MMQQPEAPVVLAHWQYTPDEWRPFSDLEVNSTRFDITDTHLKFIAAGAVFVGLVTASNGGAGAAILTAVVGAGLLVALIAISRSQKTARQERLEERPGEVWIMPDGICINGSWSYWGDLMGRGELQSVRRSLAEDRAELSITPGPRVDVLRFKVLYRIKTRGVEHRTHEEWRVPVPAGRELEADAVVRWFAERYVDSEKPVGGPLNGAWPHEFVDAVCRKCGTSAKSAMEFKWGCPES